MPEHSTGHNEQSAWLLHLLRLTSPSLPIGAYAYSRGLEYAVQAGAIHDEASAGVWIVGLLEQLAVQHDGPFFLRLYAALQTGDESRAEYWNALLLASREGAELRLEDTQLGAALVRWVSTLDAEAAPLAERWLGRGDVCHATAFALAALRGGVPAEAALSGFLWAQAEGQTSAAVRLIPLGQTAGQRVLSQVARRLPDCVQRAVWVTDDAIGAFAPGLAIASALHETQYSRLFRS
ncbi:MAG: urease accessory protein UreF [Polyangiales bacterium]